MRVTPEDIQRMKDAGLVTVAENPWTNPDGKLYKIARENGYKIRPGKIVRKTPRWAKARMHLEGMSVNQLMVVKHLVETIRTADRDETGKLKEHPTVLVQKAFEGWEKAERKPKRKGVEGLRKVLEDISDVLAKKTGRRVEEVEAMYRERRAALARA
jgi:hypothetical protein